MKMSDRTDDNRELKEMLKWSLRLQQNKSSPGGPINPEVNKGSAYCIAAIYQT